MSESFNKRREEPVLKETDPDTLTALEDKLREIADVAGTMDDRISDADIKQAAFSYALRAEKEGNPLTAEDIAAFDGKKEMEALGVLANRLDARPNAPVQVMRGDNYIGSADTVSGAKEFVQSHLDEEQGDRA